MVNDPGKRPGDEGSAIGGEKVRRKEVSALRLLIETDMVKRRST